MTAVLDLHPDTGHPAAAAVREIHALLDTLHDDLLNDVDASAPLPSGGYAALVADCDRAVTRLQALKLKLLAAADKAEVALDAGMPGTSAWLAVQTRAGGADAAREVRLASALDEDLPATATALDSGALSPAHAVVIAHTAARLPAPLSVEDRVRVEAALVAQAKRLDPILLRRAARRALEAVERDIAVVDAHEDALLRDEETAALERTRLTLHDNHDGTVSGHFTVPALAGAILRKALQQLASPRRRGAHTGPHPDPDWARRQGEAFVEVLEHLPTDRLHGKVAATVILTLDHDKLRDQLAAAGLDTGERISAAETRRLACSAGILPAILDGASQVLDLGRTQRFFTEAQRVALATRHTTCAADGCDRPFAWCELHHRTPWSHGGRTDLKDAIPLCGHHHRRLHLRI